MGLDPGYRNGCKVAVVDGTGKVLDNIDKGFVNALYDYRRGDYFEA